MDPGGTAIVVRLCRTLRSERWIEGTRDVRTSHSPESHVNFFLIHARFRIKLGLCSLDVGNDESSAQ